MKRNRIPLPHLEERANSWALSLVEVLESNAHTRTRAYAAAGAGLFTIVMWVVHLLYPEIFTSLIQVDGLAKAFAGIVLAPPFIVALAVVPLIYRPPAEPASSEEIGPMSTYFYQERSSRRWKLLMMAGVFTALNFLLMIITSAV